MARTEVRGALLDSTGWLERVRAFSIFAALLAVLVWAAHAAAFRDMSEIARRYRMLRAAQEATRVAEAVTVLGQGPAGLDFYRLRQDRAGLQRMLSARLADRPDLRYVAVRDRFGALVAAVPANPKSIAPGLFNLKVALMAAGVPQGEVQVGVSAEAIDSDIESLRRALRFKVVLVAILGICLLGVGLGYSLYLGRKNRALEQARQASERRAYRVNLGSGLAHEIRNPLNSMNMNLQMLEEELQGVPGLEGGEHVEMLRSMQGEIKRIKNLVDAFLEYSRPAYPHFEVKDLNEVLNGLARFLQADFRQSDVDLALDLEPLLPSVEIDEGQLRQALLNIIGNARQVVPRGGSVRLASRAGVGGEVVIEVADTGPGIAAETLDKIFEPFFSKRAGGTGLGLAIARQMVDNHRGRIEVESTVGKGTTFRIRLPRRQPPSADVAQVR